MKNVICAWATILVMGVGTAAAAAHAVGVERRLEQARVVKVKRPRLPKPAAAPEPVFEEQAAQPAVKPARVKPAPRSPVDTRQLSRVSRRQA